MYNKIDRIYFGVKKENILKLVIENLKKTYDKKEVIKCADFEFELGKIYALLGRNGSGKTTLFNCINDDIPFDSGSIYFEENAQKKQLKAEDVGYVLSTPSVPAFLTAREFVNFFIDINKDKIQNIKTAEEYLNMVGILDEDKDRLLKDYSLGMKNKIQMLVNFIANPKLLLLDEPLTSFDVVVADEMKQLLKSIKNEHIIIFSTHIMELALELCDEIAILSAGKLTAVQKDKDIIIETLRRDSSD